MSATDRLEAFGANECICEINGQERDNGSAQDVVEQHLRGPLQSITGAGVGHAQHEERGCAADENDVDHWI